MTIRLSDSGKQPLPALTDAQLAQLRALDGRAPDTDDIPEVPAAN